MVCQETIRYTNNLATSLQDLYQQYEFIPYTEDKDTYKYVFKKQLVYDKIGGIIAGKAGVDGVPIKIYVLENESVIFETEILKNPDDIITVFNEQIVNLV